MPLAVSGEDMDSDESIPAAIQEAYEVARAKLVDAKPLVRLEGHAGFRITGRIGYDHPEGCPFPVLVPIRLELLPGYPHVPPRVYPETGEIVGYPHQTHNGQICPPPDADWDPSDAREAMEAALCHVSRWLSYAATGTLTQIGDRYELPDFPCSSNGPLVLWLHAMEEMDQLRSNGVHRSGALDALIVGDFAYALGPVLVRPPGEYKGRDAAALASARNLLSRQGSKKPGWWLYIPHLLELPPKRAPLTFAELWQLAGEGQEAALASLENAIEQCPPSRGFLVGLLGFPIPERVGEPPTSVHWQALMVRVPRKTRKHRKKWARNVLGIGSNEPLQWLKTQSLAPERFFARAVLPYLGNQHVVVFGCGALGCVIAELLARAGVGRLTLVDHDVVETGNLCRHILTITDVGKPKALALGTRLMTIHPGMRVVTSCIDVFAIPANSEQAAQLADAHLWIDTTGSRNAVRHLADVAAQIGVRFASTFITREARYVHLYIGAPEARISVADMESRFRSAAEQPTATDVLREAKAAAWDLGEPDLAQPEPGCYHPTFRAAGYDVWVVAAMIAGAITDILVGQHKGALGLILRRPHVWDDPVADAPGAAGTVIWRDLAGEEV